MSKAQTASLAEICRDIAQVILAGAVIEPLVSNRFDFLLFTLGLFLAGAFWYVNLIILKDIKI